MGWFIDDIWDVRGVGWICGWGWGCCLLLELLELESIFVVWEFWLP